MVKLSVQVSTVKDYEVEVSEETYQALRGDDHEARKRAQEIVFDAIPCDDPSVQEEWVSTEVVGPDDEELFDVW
jgi:hypothetical protein